MYCCRWHKIKAILMYRTAARKATHLPTGSQNNNDNASVNATFMVNCQEDTRAPTFHSMTPAKGKRRNDFTFGAFGGCITDNEKKYWHTAAVARITPSGKTLQNSKLQKRKKSEQSTRSPKPNSTHQKSHDI